MDCPRLWRLPTPRMYGRRVESSCRVVSRAAAFAIGEQVMEQPPFWDVGEPNLAARAAMVNPGSLLGQTLPPGNPATAATGRSIARISLVNSKPAGAPGITGPSTSVSPRKSAATNANHRLAVAPSNT